MNDSLIAKHVADLRHAAPRVRYEAVMALVRLGDVSVVPDLVKELQAYTVYYDPTQAPDDKEMPWRLVEALGVLRDPAAVPALVEALANGNQRVRTFAVEALGRIGDLSATPGLMEALVRSGAHIHWEAANALNRPGDMSAVPPLIPDWGRTRDTQISRFAIVGALGRIGQPAAVSALAEALLSHDPVIREMALKELTATHHIALPKLLRMLKDGERPVTDEFMLVIGQIGAPLLPDLILALRDRRPVVRCRAAETLGRIRDPAAVPALASVLQDPSQPVRWDAALALDHLEHSAGLPVIVEILMDSERRPEVFLERCQSDPGSGRRRATQLGYAQSKVGAVAVPALLDVLKEPDMLSRDIAVERLRRLGDSEKLPRMILAERLFSIPERIDLLERLRAVRGLDAWYQFPNTPALCRKVIAEPNPDTKDEAQTILNWLTLLRGSEGIYADLSAELVRPTSEDGASGEPKTMLRASEQPQAGTDAAAAGKTLWQRLFRK